MKIKITSIIYILLFFGCSTVNQSETPVEKNDEVTQSVIEQEHQTSTTDSIQSETNPEFNEIDNSAKEQIIEEQTFIEKKDDEIVNIVYEHVEKGEEEGTNYYTIAEPETPDTMNVVYKNIENYIQEGDSEKALDEIKNLSDDERKENDLLYATLLFASGKVNEAKTVFHEIVEKNPDDTEALFNLSIIEGIDGNINKQKTLLSEVLEKDPNNSQAHAALGDICITKRQYSKAIDHYSKSLENESDNMVAKLGMARSLLYSGEAKKALPYFDEVIQKETDFTLAFVDRSKARMETGDYNGAYLDLTSAVENDPDYYWNYIDRGKLCLMYLNDLVTALDDFDKAIELDSDYFYPYIYRAAVYDGQGKTKKAIDDYEYVLAQKPEYSPAYFPLALLYYKDEQWDKAEKIFTLAYGVDPEEYKYAAMITLCRLKTQTYSQMKYNTNKMIEKIPRDNPYYHLLRTFFERGYDGYMMKILSKDTNKILFYEILCYLSEYYYSIGQYGLAQTYFQEVVDADYNDTIEYRFARERLSTILEIE